MKKVTLVALSVIVLGGTFAAAQQPGAAGAQGQPAAASCSGSAIDGRR